MTTDLLERFRRRRLTLNRDVRAWITTHPSLSDSQIGGPTVGADPLLHWLVFTGLCLFALLLLGFFGLLQRMVSADRSFISSVIALLYVATSCHCLWRVLAISREAAGAARFFRALADRRLEHVVADDAVSGSASLEPGLIAAHVRDLAEKARLQGHGRLDQTLMLRALASRLRGSNQFGAFMGDTLMKLGLLGTDRKSVV